MRTVIATLESISPYSQSRYYEMPAETRSTGTETETKSDYEERTWRERMHCTEKGEVFIPPMAFKNALTSVAKYLSIQIPGQGKKTYTAKFTAGVMCMEPTILPGKMKDQVEGERLFVPAEGIRGSGKRVMKIFPLIREWVAPVTIHVLDDIITKKVFEQHLREAGNFVGIGRFRPEKNGFYGRFNVKSLKWS